MHTVRIRDRRLSFLDRGAARVALSVAGYVLVLRLFWPAPAEIWVEGAIFGSLTALSAFAIGLVYRTSGVINLAQADLGLVPVTVFAALVTNRSWSYLPALAASLALAAALGLLVERVVIRRFSRRPRLVATIATLALGRLLAGFAESLVASLRLPEVVVDGTRVSAVPRFDPPFEIDWQLGFISFDEADVFAVLCVAALMMGLTVVLMWTPLGLATRAIADGEERASLVGLPVPRLKSLVWVVAAVLAGFSLILRGGMVGLPSESLFGPSFLLAALAAAAIGGLERFAVIFVAALGVGILELSVLWDQRSSDLIDPLLCVAIVAALVVHGRGGRDGAEETWTQAPLTRPVPTPLRALRIVRILRAVPCAVLATSAVVLGPLYSARALYLVTAMVVLAIVTVSVVVLVGWTGEVTLGQMALVSIGCLVANVLVVRHGAEPTVAVLVAGAAGALGGGVLAAVATRVRGVMLAVATLAVGIGVSTYLLNPEFSSAAVETFRHDRPELLWVIPIGSDVAFYYVALVALAGTIVACAGVRRARTGRAMLAVRENATAAAAFGLSTVRTRTRAFVIAGSIGSAAGALLVVHQLVIPHDLIGPMESIRALSMAVVGGVSSLLGGVVGTIFVMSTRWFANVAPPDLRPSVTSLGTGGGLLIVLLLVPGGIAGVTMAAWERVLRRVSRREGIAVRALGTERTGAGAEWTPAQRLARRRRRLVPTVLRRNRSAASALRLADVSAAYGPVQALSDVDLGVQPGRIVALLGPNGAGKSTVLRAVSGLVTTTGTIECGGRTLTALAPHQIARLGVVHVPAGSGVFPSLTVAQNLRLASWGRRGDRRSADAGVARALERFPMLVPRLHQRAGSLSGGEQRIVKFAMLVVARPTVLLVDEVSLGLAPKLVRDVRDLLASLRDDGVAVLMVEHSLPLALALADDVYVMEGGAVRFHGSPAEVSDRPELLPSLFLARAAEAARVARIKLPRAETPWSSGAPLLRAEALCKSFGSVSAVDRATLEVHRRQVVGVVGPNGAGKTTLLDLLSGQLPVDSGTVHVQGIDVTHLPVHSRARLGLGRSFQDARLFQALTVRETIGVALDRHLGRAHPAAEVLWLPQVGRTERWLGARTDEVVDLLGLGDVQDQFVAELSTGTRRIVDVAAQIASRPRILLLDEPTAGLAQRETELLGELLLRIRKETDASLVVIDHDVGLVASVADHLIALDLGRVIAEGRPQEVLRDDAVIEAYTGRATVPNPTG